MLVGQFYQPVDFILVFNEVFFQLRFGVYASVPGTIEIVHLGVYISAQHQLKIQFFPDDHVQDGFRVAVAVEQTEVFPMAMKDHQIFFDLFIAWIYASRMLSLPETGVADRSSRSYIQFFECIHVATLDLKKKLSVLSAFAVYKFQPQRP